MRNLKKRLAWGGALSGGATGLSIGSNPALTAATGGWSPLIGAGIGAIAGTITEDKRIAEQKKLDEEAKKKLDALSLKQNNIYNQDFPFKGTTGAEIYKYGGKLKKQFGNGGNMLNTSLNYEPKNNTFNKATNFEKRIFDNKLTLQNSDGTTSTHKMMSWESDGKYYAAPTIVEQNGKLIELSPDDAINYALKNNEYREFNSDKEAQDYANNGYKKGTPLEQFKYGGQLKKKYANGGLMPISQDASKVVGPTHEEGGVDLNSQEEVEKDEVIVGDKVFSKRLGFADIAMKIINTPQYKEFENEKNQNEMVLKNLKSGMSSKGTAKRNIEKLGVNPLDVLFEQQTKFAQENNIPQNGEMAYGGQLKKKYAYGNPDYKSLLPSVYDALDTRTTEQKVAFNPNAVTAPDPLNEVGNYGSNQIIRPEFDITKPTGTFQAGNQNLTMDGYTSTSTNNLKSPNKFNVGDFAPLLDNAVNLALTKKTPKIPNQALITPRALETKYDITANLNELNTDFNNFNKNIDRTTTDVGMANANKQQAFTSLIKGKNVLYGNKINQEVAMRNANKKLQLDIEGQNNATDYNNRFKQSMREGDIQDRYSKNAKNLTEDLTQFKIDQKLEANDTATLEMYYKVYNKYGTLDRNFSDTELKTIGFTDEQITRFRKGK